MFRLLFLLLGVVGFSFIAHADGGSDATLQITSYETHTRVCHHTRDLIGLKDNVVLNTQASGDDDENDQLIDWQLNGTLVVSMTPGAPFLFGTEEFPLTAGQQYVVTATNEETGASATMSLTVSPDDFAFCK